MLECVHGADRRNVTGREDRVELDSAREQLFRGSPALGFIRRSFDAKALVGLDTRRAQGSDISAPALVDFGIAWAGGSNERDPAAALPKQMRRGVESTLLIVR
jgi:hypothetical protein